MYKYFIALRYLRSRFITMLAVAGVAIGVMALIIVVSVMGGFSSELHERIRGTGGHINIKSLTFYGIRNVDEIENAVNAIPEVKGTSPYLESLAFFKADTLEYGRIKGIDPLKEINVGKFNKYLLTDEEAVAYRDVDRLKEVQKYVRASQEKFGPKLKEMFLKAGVSEEFYAARLEEAGDVYEEYYRKKAPLNEIPPAWMKRFGGKNIPDEMLRQAFSFGISLRKSKLDRELIAKYQEIKDATPDRKEKHPFTPEQVMELFTTKRKYREDSVELTNGTVVTGDIMDEDSTEVRMRTSGGSYVVLDRGRIHKIEKKAAPLIVGIELLKQFNADLNNRFCLYAVDMYNFRKMYCKEFEIVGVFKTGMFETDMRIAYSDVESVQDFLEHPGSWSGVAVKLGDYSDADKVKPLINDALSGYYGTVEPFTWEEENRTIISAVKLEKWLLYFILIFMIIIAGFMNLCILTMMVVEKTKDLGIIKAIGGSTRGVFSIFLLTGGFIGIIGTLIGTIAGGLFVIFINDIASFVETLTGVNPFPSNVYYLDKIPTAFMPVELTFVIVPAIVISFLFSLYPAFRAAQLDPIEAFRHE